MKMTIHRAKTREQENFLTNVERAKRAGITTSTSQSVYHALLGGLSYCNFGHAVASLTDNYLADLQDYLADEAIDQGKYEAIRWIGFLG
jgi:hypothetical protein